MALILKGVAFPLSSHLPPSSPALREGGVVGAEGGLAPYGGGASPPPGRRGASGGDAERDELEI